MTQLIALRRAGISSIVADSLVTQGIGRDRSYDFASIKNGILCPGIIYGVCGDAEGALKFVVDFRAQASGIVDPVDSWKNLERFVSQYSFPQPPRGRFAVLISSRHSGSPCFYCIDSYQERIVACDQDVGFMGSEGADLDAACSAFLGAFLNESRSAELLAKSPHLRPHDIPHFLVFFLYQQGFGDRSYDLQQIGVGGYFSYVWQDGASEGRQSTGLYLVAQAYREKRILVIHRHRIAFDFDPLLGELMVVTEKPHGQPAAWYVLIQNMTDNTVSVAETKLLDEIIARHSCAPPYDVLLAGSGSALGGRYAVWPDVCAPGLAALADLTDYTAPQLMRFLEFIHEEAFEAWAENVRQGGSELTIRLDPWKKSDEE